MPITKKKLIALLLAVITIIHICVPALPVIAQQTQSEGEGTSLIGSMVRFNTKDSLVYLYKSVASSGPSSDATRISPSALPDTYVILDVYTVSYGTQFYKIGTVDGSSHDILDTYPWVKALLMEIVPDLEPDLIKGQVDLTDGSDKLGELTVKPGEKEYVFTDLGEQISTNATYRWQLLVDKADSRWADIIDYCYPYAVVTEALILNARDESGIATMRCIVTDGDKKYVSNNIKVSLEKPKALLSEAVASSEIGANARLARNFLDSSSKAALNAFHIVIEYVYLHENAVDPLLNGSTAANTLTITLPPGAAFNTPITSPPLAGYKPYIEWQSGASEEGLITYGGKQLIPADKVAFNEQKEAVTVTVYYVPQIVSYRVKYLKQNLQNDEYVEWKTEFKTGIADTAIAGDLAVSEIGFSPLYYEKSTPITNDGDTVVEIYYDRIYYLVEYEIGKEAYGVTPNYVRYGTSLMLGNPTNPGYSFNGWKLTSVKDTKDGPELLTAANLTTTYQNYNVTAANSLITVAHNLVYTAQWTVGRTSYTVVYWLEDPEYDDATGDPDKKYEIWGMETRTGVNAGTVVDGPAAGSVPNSLRLINNAVVKAEGNRTMNVNLLNYLDFVSSDQDVTVAGDGSTVVNVYYDRKEYTLKFYYARKNRDQWSVCGRTNVFGNEAPNNNNIRNDELALLNNIGGDFYDVTSQPTFQDDYSSKYTFGSERYNDTENVYYYISFKAKYGADISDLYPCDIFNPVANTGRTSFSKSNLAVMSAWTGEYNVAFSYVGGNQTMKGRFQILDYRMLWHPSAAGWNTNQNNNTVAYLCFWENAGAQSWNIPELYRYKIWIPVLTGQDLTGKTTMVRNGTTYYLFDVYDTCDNSTVDEQTQPTLKGFTANSYTSIGNIYAGGFNRNQLSTAEYQEITANAMKDLYNEAFVINYFYTRNTYKLMFFDSYHDVVEEDVPYQADLNAYKGQLPEYPSTVEKNAIAFAGDGNGTGWYLDKGFTMEFDFDQLMGVNNIQLYAKWEPTLWDVEVYLDVEQTIPLYNATLPFGSKIPEPDYKKEQAARPSYKDLIWAGWYYTDAMGNEVRFDFNTMVLKTNYDGSVDPDTDEQYPSAIYAKWTSEIPIAYTVYYVTEDANGDYVNVADPTEGVALAGINKSFIAKAGENLYPEYRDYIPLKRSISHKMSVIAEENVIYFEYVTTHDIEYTVKHVFQNSQFTEILGTDMFELSWSYTITTSAADFSGRFMISFDADLYTHVLAHPNGSELWDIIEDLSPDAYKQELILTTDESNEVVFYWEDHGEVFIYQVIHYFQRLDYKDLPADEQYTAEYYQEFVGAYADQNRVTVHATPVERQGFTLNNSKSVLSMVLNKSDDGIKERVLEVYYDRDTISYTVQHIYGGNVDTVNKTALYEQVVTETARTDILGYVIADTDKAEQSVSITYDGQMINFYYVAQQVIFNYQVIGNLGGYISNPQETVSIGTPALGSAPEAMAGYIFIGWYTDEDATTKVLDSWVDSNGKLTPVAYVADANKMITFYAKFAPNSLTIRNSFTSDTQNPDPALDLIEQGFIYNIRGIDGTPTQGIHIRVAVLSGGSQTILALPVGDYVVTVESEWSWRYTTVDEVYVTMADGTNSQDAAISSATWTLIFTGSGEMQVTYDLPGADVSGGADGDDYYYVTDNAVSETN